MTLYAHFLRFFNSHELEAYFWPHHSVRRMSWQTAQSPRAVFLWPLTYLSKGPYTTLAISVVCDHWCTHQPHWHQPHWHQPHWHQPHWHQPHWHQPHWHQPHWCILPMRTAHAHNLSCLVTFSPLIKAQLWYMFCSGCQWRAGCVGGDWAYISGSTDYISGSIDASKQ